MQKFKSPKDYDRIKYCTKLIIHSMPYELNEDGHNKYLEAVAISFIQDGESKSTTVAYLDELIADWDERNQLAKEEQKLHPNPLYPYTVEKVYDRVTDWEYCDLLMQALMDGNDSFDLLPEMDQTVRFSTLTDEELHLLVR